LAASVPIGGHLLYRTPHTEKLHVIERWRIVDDGNAMEATVNGPNRSRSF